MYKLFLGLCLLVLSNCAPTWEQQYPMLTAWEETDWMVTAEHLTWDFTCEDKVRDVAFWNVRISAQEWRNPIAGEIIHYNSKIGYQSRNIGSLKLIDSLIGPKVYLTTLSARAGDSGRVVRGEDNKAVGIVVQCWGKDCRDKGGLMAFVPTYIIREAFVSCQKD